MQRREAPLWVPDVDRQTRAQNQLQNGELAEVSRGVQGGVAELAVGERLKSGNYPKREMF